jgi:hypothetical protein
MKIKQKTKLYKLVYRCVGFFEILSMAEFIDILNLMVFFFSQFDSFVLKVSVKIEKQPLSSSHPPRTET